VFHLKSRTHTLPLPLHDALPISLPRSSRASSRAVRVVAPAAGRVQTWPSPPGAWSAIRRHSHASNSSVGTTVTALTVKNAVYEVASTKKPDTPPANLPGRLASETSSANWVAVKLRSVSADMNAISTTPAKPWNRLSAEMAA